MMPRFTMKNQEMFMEMTHVKRGRWGFTLIELLVVISIIALLLSILMPGLSKARKMAQRITCSSGLHQMAMGFNIFVLENKGKLPAPIEGDEGYEATCTTWDKAISSYLAAELKNKGEGGEAKMADVFGCSADKVVRESVQNGAAEFVDVRRKRSYSMVTWEAPWPYWHYRQTLSTAKSPAERFLVGEMFETYNVRHMNWNSFIWRECYVGGSVWAKRGVLLPSPYKGNYHGKGSNFLFLDGHTSWLQAIDAVNDKYWSYASGRTFPTRDDRNSGFE